VTYNRLGLSMPNASTHATEWRRDGIMVTLLVWETECPDCGAAFEEKTTVRKSAPRRRCKACKRPGKPVQMRGATP
jgi:hypothetical protein